MSAAAQAPVRTGGSRRRVPRYPITVPVDITPLYPGATGSIPGRALNICQLGMAAAVAGELPADQLVRLEFPLPGFGTTLQTQAVVRYQAGLCCGVEFLGLSQEHQEIIRNTIRDTAPKAPPDAPETLPSATAADVSPSAEAPRPAARRHTIRRVILSVIFAVVVGLAWWRWSRAWDELESRVPTRENTFDPMRARVSAEVMEQRLTHRVDVDAPHQAPGIVVLGVIIGRDGTVSSVRPIAGPDALTPAAMQAVKWWRYQPYLVNGKAVEVETTVAVQF